MQGFTVVDLVILVIYLAAVLFAGLHFAKKNEGKSILKETELYRGWVTSVSTFRNTVKSDFIPVISRKLIRRNMDHVVRTAWYAVSYPDHDKILPANLQQTGY